MTSPDGLKQAVVAVGSGSNTLYASLYDRSSWTTTSLGTVATSTYRCFAAAYEQQSGQLLIAAATTTNQQIKYWVHDGSSWVVDGSTYTFTVRAASAGQQLDLVLAVGVVAPTLAPAAVVDQLLAGGSALTSDERRYMALQGNVNGAYDIGDVTAWFDEHPGSLNPSLLRRLARWDAATSGRPDRYLANSQYVADRIRRYYNRRSAIVYPPVDTDFFRPADVSPEPLSTGNICRSRSAASRLVGVPCRPAWDWERPGDRSCAGVGGRGASPGGRR